jgi:hypothetical protein
MDCTITGASEPTRTLPMLQVTDFLRRISAMISSFQFSRIWWIDLKGRGFSHAVSNPSHYLLLPSILSAFVLHSSPSADEDAAVGTL